MSSLEYGSLPGDREVAGTWPWLHVPTDRPITLELTCPLHLGGWVHFFPGRSALCARSQCEFCESGGPARWRCWISGINQVSGVHGLVELGHRQLPTIRMWLREVPSLRGRIVELRHESSHRFSLIELSAGGWSAEEELLPEPPDLVEVVRRRLTLPTNADHRFIPLQEVA